MAESEIEMINHINKLRQKNKMTMADLASIVGTTKSYICDVENGKISPGLEKAYAIARAFKCSVYRVFPDEKR